MERARQKVLHAKTRQSRHWWYAAVRQMDVCLNRGDIGQAIKVLRDYAAKQDMEEPVELGSEVYALEYLIGTTYAEKLFQAGYRTVGSVLRASEKDLREVSLIGPYMAEEIWRKVRHSFWHLVNEKKTKSSH